MSMNLALILFFIVPIPIYTSIGEKGKNQCAAALAKSFSITHMRYSQYFN